MSSSDKAARRDTISSTVFTGKVLFLKASILGIHSEEGRRTAMMIPEGATVQVVSGPRADDRMVDVLWEGRTLSVFAEDIFRRSKEMWSVKDERARST